MTSCLCSIQDLSDFPPIPCRYSPENNDVSYNNTGLVRHLLILRRSWSSIASALLTLDLQWTCIYVCVQPTLLPCKISANRSQPFLAQSLIQEWWPLCHVLPQHWFHEDSLSKQVVYPLHYQFLYQQRRAEGTFQIFFTFHSIWLFPENDQAQDLFRS